MFCSVIGNEFMAAKLSEPGQFTVFAPTDEAFAKLDTETRERLMKGESCIHSEFLPFTQTSNLLIFTSPTNREIDNIHKMQESTSSSSDFYVSNFQVSTLNLKLHLSTKI